MQLEDFTFFMDDVEWWSEKSLRILGGTQAKFQLRHNFQTAFHNISRGKGRQVVGRATAHEWFAEFRNGDVDLADQLRSRDRLKLIKKQSLKRLKKIRLCQPVIWSMIFQCSNEQMRKPERWQNCIQVDGECFN
ncbi:hypothetical protein KIN20_014395 [Parelaphostrongylus tenuis]|uniref:HTH_48 domain-containing protein n=1 Tax=Parelaphostrongylus tenuis TaxID=148309 RepID=A0AAD5MDK4_PARTN|nr:hypothetical protein KIN20_014395 [Parelaphostrongylus tenuis]